MFKIVITGPESTGKSTLTKQLASQLEATFVNEFARGYLQNLNRDYNQSDLIEIAKGQIKLEEEAYFLNPKNVICDTSLEVIKIWSQFKYQSCNPFIEHSMHQRRPNLYLLMSTDLPWESDPLRENPDDREKLFDLYKNELVSSKVPFYEIYGNGEERFKMAKEVIKKYSF